MPTMTDAELEEAAIREYAEDACYGDMEDAREYWPIKDEFDRRVYFELARRRIPEGSVVIERARFERLLANARVGDEVMRYDPHMEDVVFGAAREGDRLTSASRPERAWPDTPRIQDGDLDPLP